jgi:hypothetical protein
MSFKIYHDDDYFEIIGKVNSQLEIHNLRFEFEEGEFDGYDVVKLKTIVQDDETE